MIEWEEFSCQHIGRSETPCDISASYPGASSTSVVCLLVCSWGTPRCPVQGHGLDMPDLDSCVRTHQCVFSCMQKNKGNPALDVCTFCVKTRSDIGIQWANITSWNIYANITSRKFMMRKIAVNAYEQCNEKYF